MPSKLDAVNEMLEAVGEKRINTLVFTQSDGSVNFDAEMALNILERETKRALSKGWYFNRDDRHQLTPDVNQVVYIPKDTLSIEEANGVRDQYVRRGVRLYNRTQQAFLFSSKPLCRLVWNMDFEDCPIIFSEYVTLKSVRQYIDKVLGDQVLHGYTKEDEERAYIELVYEENQQLDANVFETPDMVDALDRRSSYAPYWLY